MLAVEKDRIESLTEVIRNFIIKAALEYQFEQVKCFCGRDDGEIVTTKDRYGMPHKMVLCKCGLIYANPRMTSESLQRFYEEDYREIYDKWEFGKKDVEAKAKRYIKKGIGNGRHLMGML